MARLAFVRIAGAMGIIALGLFFVSLIPFLSSDPGAGARPMARTPAVVVNRAFKGDRLPLPSEINSGVSRNDNHSEQVQGSEKIPVGCDPAFSPVATPQLASYYGRCTA